MDGQGEVGGLLFGVEYNRLWVGRDKFPEMIKKCEGFTRNHTRRRCDMLRWHFYSQKRVV